jgi:serine/threonine protein kinase
MTAPISPDPPEVPDFDLIRCIGEGAFGAVWLAANRTTGRLRAVKLIPLDKSGAGSPAYREIVSLKHLEARVNDQQPGLLAVHHVGRTDRHLFYVMDPADDISGAAASRDPGYEPATLQRRLASGPLPAQQCFDLARQLLVGLRALHAAGMVHRDVKPANCLFVVGELKLADFGLLTEAGPLVSRLGTRRYMPPDGRMDTRADIYAAGLVIYQMFTGLGADRFPRLGPRAREIAADPVLQKLNQLVLKAGQPDPARRFQDAGQMLAQLETPAVKASRSGRRALAWVTCLISGALLVAISAWRPGPRKNPATLAGPTRVEVNFLTEPYQDAAIYLDGELLRDAQQKPFTTPCTVPDVPAGEHRVVFTLVGHGELDAGLVDFCHVREVEARWPTP